MRCGRRIAITLSLLLTGSPASGDTSLLSGPIRLRNVYPLSELHLSHRPTTPFPASSASGRIRAAVAISNSSVDRRSLSVDAESRVLALSYTWLAEDWLELEAELPYHWRGAGFTDDAIDSWHDTFGLPEGSRKRQGDDEYSIAGQNRDGSAFSLEDGAGVGNAMLSLKSIVAKGYTSALAVAVSGSFPSAESGFGHRGIDGSFALVAGSDLGRVSLGISAAYLAYGDREVSGVSYADTHWEGSASLEYRALDWLALQLAVLGGENAIEVREHDEHAFYVDIGGVARVSERSAIELLLRENPWTGQGTADVTALVGLRFGL